MCFDILTFVKEPFQKSTFVRLVGQHDSTYLIVMFTLLVSLMSVMDAIAVNTVHLTNLIYIPLVMYQVVKIMDTKQARLANSFFPLLSLFFTLAAIYVFLAANVVASKDTVGNMPTFPLYTPKPDAELAGLVEGEAGEPAEPLTWAQAVWARCSLGGFWFFLDWVIYPFWNWLVVPWYTWTIQPVLGPIFNAIGSLWIFNSEIDPQV